MRRKLQLTTALIVAASVFSLAGCSVETNVEHEVRVIPVPGGDKKVTCVILIQHDSGSTAVDCDWTGRG